MIEYPGFVFFLDDGCPHFWILPGCTVELIHQNLLKIRKKFYYDVIDQGKIPYFKISRPMEPRLLHIRYVLFVRKVFIHDNDEEVYMINTNTGAIAYSVLDYPYLFQEPVIPSPRLSLCMNMPVRQIPMIPSQVTYAVPVGTPEFAPALNVSGNCLGQGCPGVNHLIDFMLPLVRYKSCKQDVDKKLIQKRSIVIKHFLDNSSDVLKGILQKSSTGVGSDVFCVDGISVYLKSQLSFVYGMYFHYGWWVDDGRRIYGVDIAELYSYVYTCSYSQSVDILWSSLSGKVEINDESLAVKKKYHKQQKFPTGIPPIDFIDLDPFLLDFPCAKYYYRNEHGVLIVVCLAFLVGVEHCSIYYTLQSHHKTSLLGWFPVFPDSPLDVYNCNFIKEWVSDVVFMNSEFDADQAMRENVSGVVYSACPGGLKNIAEADFSELRNKNVHIDCVGVSLGLDVLELLKEKMKENGLKKLTLKSNSNNAIRKDVCSILNSCMPQQPLTDVEVYSVEIDEIIPSGVRLPGADRIREMFVDSLIESGTLVWIFAKEKVGKSWIGLSLAYAVSVGERNIGPWISNKPKKVLYINGEIQNDKLEKNIHMIMRGFEGVEVSAIPFDIYSVNIISSGYTSILDEEWRKKFDKKINKYDVVFIDTYNSLMANTIKISEVIRWTSQFTMQNKSVVILDHTNKESELQGSIDKGRLADIGVKLEKDSFGRVKVEYKFVRYFDDKNTRPFVLTRKFTEIDVRHELFVEEVDHLSRMDKTNKAKVFSVALKKRDPDYILENIAHLVGVSKSSVGKYLKDYEEDDFNFKDVDPLVDDDQFYRIRCAVEAMLQMSEDEFCKKLKEYKDELQGNAVTKPV